MQSTTTTTTTAADSNNDDDHQQQQSPLSPPSSTTTNNNTNNNTISLRPIAYFSSVFSRKNATPRQGSLAPYSKGFLKLVPENCFGKLTTHHSLTGLQEFSHVWIIYVFHDNGVHFEQRGMVKPKIAPPRLNGRKVGVFATRAPHRPNPIGLTLAKLESVDLKTSTVHVSGIDLIDGTPVLDIKPFIPDYDNAYQLQSSQLLNQSTLNQAVNSEEMDVIVTHQAGGKEQVANDAVVRVPEWITQSPVKPIDHIMFTEEATEQLKQLVRDNRLQFYSDWRMAKLAIEQILYLDPRSVHRRKKCADQTYWFHLDGMNVSVKIDDKEDSQESTTTTTTTTTSEDSATSEEAEEDGRTATVFRIEMWQDLLDSLGLDDDSTRKKK